MKTSRKIILSILVICVLSMSFVISSCSGIMGYSVVLWNIPERNLSDGTIVPVYIKSNISHVYVIKDPNSKEKVEVPLWQISVPESKGKAKKLAQKYSAYEHQYAKCNLDGLPIRAGTVNTSKQVYRLRKNEVIRLLYEGEGQAVMSGKNAMEGKWLRVITDDGTEGWCFSYNLQQFSMNLNGPADTDGSSNKVAETDDVLDEMLASKWYPENYSTMIKSGNIDLANMQSSFGFDTGHDSGKVALRLADINQEYQYGGVSKVDESVYKFTDTPFEVTVRGKNLLVVQFTDEDGKPKSYNFITLEDNIDELIDNQKELISQTYASLRSLGPDFRSSNYGTLSFEDDNVFKWTGDTLLVPSIISEDAKNDGEISFRYFLTKNLKKKWDGVLTFKFNGMDNEVSFLYKKETNGLRLEDLTHAEIKDNTVQSEAPSALVMFFSN